MTAQPGEAPAGKATATAYARRLTIHAAPQRVFDAVATLDGLRRWWTTIVTGSAAPGGTLRFGFAGLDEQIVMRVDEARPLTAVAWSCVAHTRDDEWTGSTVRFGLADSGPQPCELNFCHTGIDRELVADGWEHFPGQPGSLRRARHWQPLRCLTDRPGQDRAAARHRWTHRSSTHAR